MYFDKRFVRRGVCLLRTPLVVVSINKKGCEEWRPMNKQ